MLTPTNTERLGHLEGDLIRAQKEAETIAASVGKSNPVGTAQLKAAVKELDEKRRHVVAAREALLGFDGFVRARHELARTEKPEVEGRIGRFLGAIQERLTSQLGGLVARISEGVSGDISHVASVIQSIQSTHDLGERTDEVGTCVDRIGKILKAGEKAVEKAIKQSDAPPVEEGLIEDEDEEVEVEIEDGEVEIEVPMDDHGYDLTAAELPDFIKKKIEERKGKEGEEDKDEKKDDEKAKKPKKGEVPPQFLKHMKKKKADDHGYVLTDEAPHGYQLDA